MKAARKAWSSNAIASLLAGTQFGSDVICAALVVWEQTKRVVSGSAVQMTEHRLTPKT